MSGQKNIAGGTHNVLYVATEHDSVYAFDADSGTQLWKVSLLGSGETTSDARGCDQVVPEIGITATPVIDRTAGPNGIIYVVAMSKSGSTYFQRLHALDVTTGAEVLGGPKNIQATFPGTGDN
ncbi:MAG: PQQ-binding-like beta-propeller repeat protein, partial [Terriglobales bacterium]